MQSHSQLLDGELSPWLANPGNPAMSPYARETGTCHIAKIVEKREGLGGDAVALTRAGALKECPPRHNATLNKSHSIIALCAYAKYR